MANPIAKMDVQSNIEVFEARAFLVDKRSVSQALSWLYDPNCFYIKLA